MADEPEVTFAKLFSVIQSNCRNDPVLALSMWEGRMANPPLSQRATLAAGFVQVWMQGESQTFTNYRADFKSLMRNEWHTKLVEMALAMADILIADGR